MSKQSKREQKIRDKQGAALEKALNLSIKKTKPLKLKLQSNKENNVQ